MCFTTSHDGSWVTEPAKHKKIMAFGWRTPVCFVLWFCRLVCFLRTDSNLKITKNTMSVLYRWPEWQVRSEVWVTVITPRWLHCGQKNTESAGCTKNDRVTSIWQENWWGKIAHTFPVKMMMQHRDHHHYNHHFYGNLNYCVCTFLVCCNIALNPFISRQVGNRGGEGNRKTSAFHSFVLNGAQEIPDGGEAEVIGEHTGECGRGQHKEWNGKTVDIPGMQTQRNIVLELWETQKAWTVTERWG